MRGGVEIDKRKERPGQMGETFIVEVKFVQNATWQGVLRTGNGKSPLYFRSALELLKMIDSALEDEGPE